MNTKENSYMEVLDKQIDLLYKARQKIVNELNNCNSEYISADKKGGRGRGLNSRSDNDRRMYMWIQTNYNGKEYIINLFKSEIDYKSGNCHSQIGRISFTKGYVTNNSKTTSPNVILKDIKGRCQTNADRTALIFNSRNWFDPIEYFENKDKNKIKEQLANKHWISIDDILNNEEISEKLVVAFEKFIKEDQTAKENE